MNLIPITPSLGAEVEGLDLTQPLSSELVRALQSAFETHQVLVFRDQVLSREAHKAFARYFGDIHVHPSKQNLKRDEDPDLFFIDIKPDSKQSNGETWPETRISRKSEQISEKYFSSKTVFSPETSRNGTKCIRMHSKRVLVAPFGFGKKNEKRIDRSYEFRSFEDRHKPPRITADLASLAAPHWGGPTTAMTFYGEKRQKLACAAHTRSSGRTMRVSILAMWDIFWSHGIPGVDTMCEHHPCPVPGLVFFALFGSSGGCFRLFWLFLALRGCSWLRFGVISACAMSATCPDGPERNLISKTQSDALSVLDETIWAHNATTKLLN